MKEKVLLASGWDNTAIAWAAINSKSLGYSTLFAIDALNLAIPNEDKDKENRILDIACGTGSLSIYGSSIYKNSKFIATDFSPKMIDLFDKYIEENQIKRIETRLLDGMNLSTIESNSMDYTFSVFGLIFFPNIVKGMKEMHRVLAPGGKTAIVGWCYDSFILSVFQETMDELLTIQNDGISVKYPLIALSLADENVFIQYLKSAGFVDRKVNIVKHPLEVNELTDLFVSFNSNPAYIDCIDALKSNELKSMFEPTFLKYAKLKNPPRSSVSNKLQLFSSSFIGIGTKK